MLIERYNIGIFGKMNSGKSSLINLLTQQQSSIVDTTPGTTTDSKIVLQEIHGIGPIKLYDTAGVDEQNELGRKKRMKVYADLKECDLVLLVIDPSTRNFDSEKEIIANSRKLGKQVLIIYNIFDSQYGNNIPVLERDIPLLSSYSKLKLRAVDTTYRTSLINFIIENFESRNQKIELLPFLKKDNHYILVIPMDVETPDGRYLRPQAMVEEYITRNWAYPTSFRLDLTKARSKNLENIVEKERFLNVIDSFKKRPVAVITDSQAIDVMYEWVPEDVMLTTFSITMTNYLSRGRLNKFAEGINTLCQLKAGDKVLIAEACNHSRIGEDIGTVQIPNFLRKNFPGVTYEHAFGKAFEEDLSKYKLIIHCGGCMISPQKQLARITDIEYANVPVTNYGIFLSYIQGEDALKRVLLPWGIRYASKR